MVSQADYSAQFKCQMNDVIQADVLRFKTKLSYTNNRQACNYTVAGAIATILLWNNKNL